MALDAKIKMFKAVVTLYLSKKVRFDVVLAMAAAMLRAPRQTARWTGLAFFLCSALFAIKLWNDQTMVLAPAISQVPTR